MPILITAMDLILNDNTRKVSGCIMLRDVKLAFNIRQNIREVEIFNAYVYGYGYQGNHRNFLRITSSISAFTRFLHVLITCGTASTRYYKRVAFKIKTS